MPEKTQAPLRDRLRYSFDNLMSTGIGALVAWLAFVTLLASLIMAALVWTAGISAEPSFVEQFWAYLMEALDTAANTGVFWPTRLAGLVVTFFGVFLTSILIGLLANAINQKIEDLRKGRSRIIESGHTVVLGWTPMVFPILSELVAAAANQPHACIAVLGNQEKVKMDEEIRARVGKTGSTRIVTRTGDPIEVDDLDIVNLDAARSIIILGTQAEDSDSRVIKTLLAIAARPHRQAHRYHIVAEIRDEKNLDVARIVGKEDAELVSSRDVIARLTAQTCHQPGLSMVYSELLDFRCDEIYFHAEPGLEGKTFGDALLAYERSAVLGLRKSTGRAALKPPMDTRLEPGDALIALAEDDDAFRLLDPASIPIRAEAITTSPAAALKPERVLILGWNWRGPFIINELDRYVAQGSSVHVAACLPEAEKAIADQCRALTNLSVSFEASDTCDRRLLDALRVDTYDHVMLLSYSDLLDVQASDARTLVTLLHLRDIAGKTGHPFSIVSEMLDIRNRDLAQITRPDDFVVSDRVVSLLLAQVSENKALGAIFTELFSSEGSEIYVRPASDYVQVGEEINFATVVEAARQRDEVAIGYRLKRYADDVGKACGLLVNPPKTASFAFEEGDAVIVLDQS